MVRLMMKFDHLYLMTSATLARNLDRSIVSIMSSSRGRGRVMYASDFPMLSIDRAYLEAANLSLPSDAAAQFLGGALARVLQWGLDPATAK
jgi:predicted TIM-barrel fold metal-dependent hydrolase